MTDVRSALGLTMETLSEAIRALSEGDLAKTRDMLRADLAMCWQPQPGPQYRAFYHSADEVLYGGAAGGGKTDLIVGLATTAHERSLIFRRQATDLDGIWERLVNMLEPSNLIRSQNGVKKRITTRDGRLIEMGHLEAPKSEKSWQGRPHDLIAFDEVAQLPENKIVFVCQWLRTTRKDQRCRVLFATNPPVPDMKDGAMVDSSTGDWLKRWFAPWIDTELPAEERANPGELRWCFMRYEGGQYITIWVDGPGWYELDTGEKWPEEDPSDETVRTKKLSKAKSRTFIQSLVSDNEYLTGSGYIERLSATPEPLRTMLMHGVFGLKLEDHPWQVIPTHWILKAQQRWRDRMKLIDERPDEQLASMRVLAADIAQGGADQTTLAAMREDGMVDRLIAKPGKDTPDGPSVVKELLLKRADHCKIILDCTGGWGLSTRDHLKTHHRISSTSCVASGASHKWTRDMSLKFLNLRAEMWWLMREALDPDYNPTVMLPPDDRLTTQLSSVLYGIRGNTIVVEAKDDVRKRIGSSTDEADAVIMANRYLHLAIAEEHEEDPVLVEHGGWNPNMAERTSQDYVADIDPLEDW